MHAINFELRDVEKTMSTLMLTVVLPRWRSLPLRRKKT